jgi:hypothetical protein
LQAWRYRKHLQLCLDRNDLAVYIAEQTVYCSSYVLLNLDLLVIDCAYYRKTPACDERQHGRQRQHRQSCLNTQGMATQDREERCGHRLVPWSAEGRLRSLIDCIPIACAEGAAHQRGKLAAMRYCYPSGSSLAPLRYAGAGH